MQALFGSQLNCGCSLRGVGETVGETVGKAVVVGLFVGDPVAIAEGADVGATVVTPTVTATSTSGAVIWSLVSVTPSSSSSFARVVANELVCAICEILSDSSTLVVLTTTFRISSLPRRLRLLTTATSMDINDASICRVSAIARTYESSSALNSAKETSCSRNVMFTEAAYVGA